MVKMENPLNAWLCELPDEWETRKLKYVFSIKKDIAGEEGHTVLSITQQGIVPKKMDEKGQFAADYSKYQLVHPGDFAMNHMDLLTGWVDISEYDGVTSPDYRVFVLNDKKNYCAEYFKYIFQLCYKHRIFYSLGQGVAGFGRWRLPADMFLNFVLPVPSFDEQVAIVKELKNIITEIDEYIKQSNSILDEYITAKANRIHEMLTRGVDVDELKDTKVPWIGQIPKHWKTIRLKYAVKRPLQYGANESGIEYDTRLPRYIRITDIDAYGNLKHEDQLSLPEDLAKPYILKENDILFARSGGTVGKAFIYKAEMGRAAYAGYLIRAEVNEEKLLPQYVYYLTLSSGYRQWKESVFIQATIQNIGAGKYSNYIMPWPPIEEQKRIVENVEKYVETVDSLILEKRQLIEELERYKFSKIYELVTGKRRVV